MNIRVALLAVCLTAGAGAALADPIVIDDQVVVPQPNYPVPARGMTMAAVEKQFGEPADRHPTVGQPPITRWDYHGFSVFFERDRVIHSVATG